MTQIICLGESTTCALVKQIVIKDFPFTDYSKHILELNIAWNKVSTQFRTKKKCTVVKDKIRLTKKTEGMG